MADDKYTTIEQAAENYQVSVSTFRSWVRTGVIPPTSYIKVGRTFRFKISEVDAALREYNNRKNAKMQPDTNPTPDQDI